MLFNSGNRNARDIPQRHKECFMRHHRTNEGCPIEPIRFFLVFLFGQLKLFEASFFIKLESSEYSSADLYNC